MIEIIITAAKLVGISPSLLYGICFAESSLRPDAIGDNGASIGLCQVQVRTAKYMDLRFQKDKEIQDKIDRLKKMCEFEPGSLGKHCINIPTVEEVYKRYLLDPRINAEVAAKYIKYQLKRYASNETPLRCAISGYNAGRCIKSNQKTYVDKVLAYAKEKEFLDGTTKPEASKEFLDDR